MIVLALKIVAVWLALAIIEGLILGPMLKDRLAAYPPIPDEAA